MPLPLKIIIQEIRNCTLSIEGDSDHVDLYLPDADWKKIVNDLNRNSVTVTLRMHSERSSLLR